MTDILTREKRTWNMSRIRDTKPEITLRSLLHKSGLRFCSHEETAGATRYCFTSL